MNKKRLLKYGVPALAIAFLVSGGIASAHGMGGMNGGFGGNSFNSTPEQIATMHNQMFQDQANLIGATVSEVKTAWANGTSFKDLAKSKGVTEEMLQAKMKARHESQMKTQMQVLVTQGVITQAEADARIVVMQKMADKVKTGKGKNNGHKSFMGL